MNDRGLSVLHAILTQTPTPHLDDDVLAEMATTEAAGEDIDSLYPSEVRHIESCPQCAQAYGEIVEMMFVAVGDMAAAAAMVKQRDVYSAILLRDIETQIGTLPHLADFVRSVADKLPAMFTGLPASPSDVSPETVETAAKEMANVFANKPQIVSAITQSIHRNLSALSLFLAGSADAVWGRAVRVKSDIETAWQTLQLRPAPEVLVPTLGGREAGREWQLLNQRVGQPVPFNVTAWAERVSPLACKVCVQVDRPGLSDVTGRAVQIHYAGQIQTTRTDPAGIACFESVPIAAIPEVEIRFLAT